MLDEPKIKLLLLYFLLFMWIVLIRDILVLISNFFSTSSCNFSLNVSLKRCPSIKLGSFCSRKIKLFFSLINDMGRENREEGLWYSLFGELGCTKPVNASPGSVGLGFASSIAGNRWGRKQIWWPAGIKPSLDYSSLPSFIFWSENCSTPFCWSEG